MLGKNIDEVRPTQDPKTEVNFVAQLMSGVRDPNDEGLKDKGKPYTANDFNIITKYINAKIRPSKEIFNQLQKGFEEVPSDNIEAQQNYLHNADIFIRQLILNDPYIGIEFNKSLKEGLAEFLDLNRKNPDLESEFDRIKVGAEQAIQKADEEKLRRLAVAQQSYKLGKESIDHFIHNSLAKSNSKMSARAKALASDLRENNLHLLRKVNPSDLYNKNWTKDDKGYKKLGWSHMTDAFNKTASMVTQDILLAKNEEHQKRIYEFYLKVADTSIKTGDFHGAHAIIGGLNNAAINRLKYLKEASDKSSKGRLSFDEMELLFDPHLRFTNLAQEVEKFKKSHPSQPYVPFTGLIVSNVEASEQNIDIRENGMLNGEKLELLGKITAGLLDAQKLAYSQKHEPFKTDMARRINAPTLSEDQINLRTLQIYPPAVKNPNKETDFSFQDKPVFNIDGTDFKADDGSTPKFQTPAEIKHVLDQQTKFDPIKMAIEFAQAQQAQVQPQPQPQVQPEKHEKKHTHRKKKALDVKRERKGKEKEKEKGKEKEPTKNEKKEKTKGKKRHHDRAASIPAASPSQHPSAVPLIERIAEAQKLAEQKAPTVAPIVVQNPMSQVKKIKAAIESQTTTPKAEKIAPPEAPVAASDRRKTFEALEKWRKIEKNAGEKKARSPDVIEPNTRPKKGPSNQ